MGVGTYFVLSGNVDALKQPFLQSLETYNPDDSSGPAKALVDVWDDFQSDVSSGGKLGWNGRPERQTVVPDTLDRFLTLQWEK